MGRRIAPWIALAGLGLWVVFGYKARPNSLIMLDVGQGLAVLYTDPAGWQLLYDGGPGGITTAALGRALPMWDTAIDVIVLSHPHQDHSAGLPAILERFQVGELWLTAPAHADPTTKEILRIAQSRRIPIRLLSRGTTIITPGGTRLTALTPVAPFDTEPPPHAHAATPVITIESTATALLTGDLDATDENELLAFCSVSVLCPASIAVLQVAHHGSKYVTSDAFLERFQPKIALISAGVDNRYNHPHQETLDRLAGHQIPFFRTDYDGTVKYSLK